MLATPGELPTGAGWAYEFKWDGARLIIERTGGQIRFYSRSGVEVTPAYPELASLGRRFHDAVFDGEVVVLEHGRPSFAALTERMHVRQRARAERLAQVKPVTLLLFDVVRLYGVDLRQRPYDERRATLERLGLEGERWQVPPAFDDGPATVQASREHALEGVVAKRLDSTYQPGVRSPDWVKVKHVRTVDLVVGGWKPGERPLRALLVGAFDVEGGLVFRGRVGGGMTEQMSAELLNRLAPLRRDTSPFATEVPRRDAQGAVWVSPTLVVEVAYADLTPDGRLRFPRVVRVRADKPAGEADGV